MFTHILVELDPFTGQRCRGLLAGVGAVGIGARANTVKRSFDYPERQLVSSFYMMNRQNRALIIGWFDSVSGMMGG